MEEKKTLDQEEQEKVSGGYAGKASGYCPYTEDRRCRNELVNGFDNENEECRTCGWRAW